MYQVSVSSTEYEVSDRYQYQLSSVWNQYHVSLSIRYSIQSNKQCTISSIRYQYQRQYANYINGISNSQLLKYENYAQTSGTMQCQGKINERYLFTKAHGGTQEYLDLKCDSNPLDFCSASLVIKRQALNSHSRRSQKVQRTLINLKEVKLEGCSIVRRLIGSKGQESTCIKCQYRTNVQIHMINANQQRWALNERPNSLEALYTATTKPRGYQAS